MQRIPKVIHYCWFGRNKKPEIVTYCISTWKRFFPDWEIVEWNEDNYDVNVIPYTKEAYQAHMWAFVADYARFDILFKFGGIYLDTDVEFIKSLPPEYLELSAFTGFEYSGIVAPGLIFACEKSLPLIKEILEQYQKEHFEIRKDGIYKTVNLHVTEILKNKGLLLNNKLQTVNGITVFPSEYFCGYDTDIHEKEITNNTICWHHYFGSWSKRSIKFKFQKVIKKIIGKKNYKKLLLKKRKICLMNEYIKSDLYRCYGNVRKTTFIRGFFEDPGFNYMFWLRLCQIGGACKFFALPIHKWKRTFGKINIGYKCKIGYGLYIGHGGPVIVADSTEIGNNCNLSQFVTIGTNEGKAATIGDNCYIGPNCCIVENVIIGDDVTIGAGAIVTHDIKSGATAVGNPARIINFNNKGKFIMNRWDCH